MMVLAASVFTEQVIESLEPQEARRFGPEFIGVAKALCDDGRQRYARITTPKPDAFQEIPATVQMWHKHPEDEDYKPYTVSGVLFIDYIAGYDVWRFQATNGRKHAILMNRLLP